MSAAWVLNEIDKNKTRITYTCNYKFESFVLNNISQFLVKRVSAKIIKVFKKRIENLN